MAYTLRINIEPRGSGSVQLKPMGDYVGPGTVTYTPGTVVTLKAYPAISLGYFDHWEGDATGTSDPITITMNSDKEITAVFGYLAPVVTLSTEVIGSGTIAPDAGVYDKGSQIILVAYPASGFMLDSWSGDIDGTTRIGVDKLSVVMDKDRHIVAKFVTIPAPPPPPPPPELEHWHKIGTPIRLALEVVVPPPPPPELEHWHKIGTPITLALAAVEPELKHWHKIGASITLALVAVEPPELPELPEVPEEKKFPVAAALLVGGGAAALALIASQKKKS